MSPAIEASLLTAARSGDADQFRALVEPYRRELLAHGYRMLGSTADAENLVQETLLRAWRKLDGFRGLSSFRSWLYKRIATNASLDVLDGRKARTLPTETHPPASPLVPLAPPEAEFAWVDPLPDACWDPGTAHWDSTAGTEARYSARQSVALGFLVALQRLPGRQRAVLLLRDVMGWSAEEAAELLDLSVSSVNSLLARARATLESVHERSRVRASDAAERALLERYVRTWESGDVTALVALLQEEASMAMPPLSSWFQGRAAIHDFICATVFAVAGSAARLIPVAANQQPAFAFYRRRGPDGPFTLLGVQLVTVDDGAIASLTTFVDRAVAARFGLAFEL